MTGHFHIIFAPLLSPHLLWALGAFAFALCAYALYCGARGAVLRAVLFAILLAAMANPSLLAEKREPLKDTALLVIDDSASMKIGTRSEQIAKAAESLTQKIAANPDLELQTLHVKGDSETDLFAAIAPQLAAIPANRLAGVIALTDGQVHDKPATPLTAPFHALIAGRHNEIDRRLIVKDAPAYGIVGKTVKLVLRITDQPGVQSDSAIVTMHRDDGTSQNITMPVEQDIPLEVPVNHGGANLYAFETPAVPGEITTLNNSAAVTVNGIRDRLRVLLVSGQPHISTRSWRDFLKADAAVDLIHFTILRSPLKENTVPNKEMALIAFPIHELFEVKLQSFDLIILDRFSNSMLIPDVYLDNIAHYVENGGALLVTNATDETTATLSNSPLARLLPAEPTGQLLTGSFVPKLTEIGKRHPVTASLGDRMPAESWGPWFRQMDARSKSADNDILMTGLRDHPLLILSHAGKGRVAEFMSDQSWLWARGAGDGRTANMVPGGPQNELMRRVSHWLVQEPDLDEGALHATGELSNGQWALAITKQSLRKDETDVTITDPQGVVTTMTLTETDRPGQLAATIPVTATGLYHVKSGDDEVMALVGASNGPEFGAMHASAEALSPVAKDSGGGIFWLADNPYDLGVHRIGNKDEAFGADWIGLRKNDQYRVTGSKAFPLWPAWALLAAIIVLAACGWWREMKG